MSDKEFTTEYVLEVWTVLEKYISPKQKLDAAISLVKSLDGEFEPEDYIDIKGEDRYLDLAVEAVFDLDETESEDQDEY